MMLTSQQQAAADKLLDRESALRKHLVVSLSGAHAYGFPSPDSDLDLKAIHVEPAARLLSLNWAHVPAEKLELIDGVEVDYSSNELRDVLAGVLIEHKRRGELAELPAEVIDRWRKDVARAFSALDESLANSPLPEEPGGVAALDEWLLSQRRKSLG
jgi:hypothetical protein